MKALIKNKAFKSAIIGATVAAIAIGLIAAITINAERIDAVKALDWIALVVVMVALCFVWDKSVD